MKAQCPICLRFNQNLQKYHVDYIYDIWFWACSLCNKYEFLIRTQGFLNTEIPRFIKIRIKNYHKYFFERSDCPCSQCSSQD
jgi:hypothetical protein